MWLVMRKVSFNFETGWGIEATLNPSEKMIGYLPIYEAREDAEAEWPGAQLVEIKEQL